VIFALASSGDNEEPAELGLYQPVEMDDVTKVRADIDAWAAGTHADGKSLFASFAAAAKNRFTKTAIGEAYMQSETAMANIDRKIAGILKENNIVLSANETLSFSADETGRVTVGDGVSADKQKVIEEAMNKDDSLWREMVAASGFRKHAEMTLQNGGASVRALANAVLKKDLETILQREYGISLDDIVKQDADELGGYGLKLKDGGGLDLFDKMYNEEHELFKSIQAVKAESGDQSFAIGFSYKNGVTVEQGKSDAATLNEIPEKVLDGILVFGKGDYSITVNADGMVSNVQRFGLQGDELSQQMQAQCFTNWVTMVNRSSFEDKTFNLSSRYLSQSALQQYVVDKQRLTQFETGARADWNQITFGRTGGKAFSMSS
jgi:hypothetical protein